MLLFMAPVTAEELMNVSPEEMRKGMELWNAWYKKSGKAIVDIGAPLVNGMHFTKNTTAKGKIEVTGYSIIQANNVNAVKEMLLDHPHFLMPEASVEIFEMMPVMM